MIKTILTRFGVLIAAAVIVLAALLVNFMWVGSMRDDLQQKMNARAQQIATARTLTQSAIDIPGQAPSRGVVTPAVIDVKTRVEQQINGEREHVIADASKINRQGRVREDTDAGNAPRPVPMMGAFDLSQVLPKINAASNGAAWYDFSGNYTRVPNLWLSQLEAVNVPTAADISDEAMHRLNEQRIQNQSRPDLRGGAGAAAGNTPQDNTKQIQDEVTRDLMYRAATGGKIYAEKDSFTMASWVKTPDYTGTASDVFDAVVGVWLQQDMVNAIVAANKRPLASTNQPPQTVAEAPVKRLIKISFADNLFLTPNPAGADYSKNVTGHTGNDTYYVALLNLSVAVNPAGLNDLISQIYRQRNGYTVTQIHLETLDPYQQASQGFLMGKQQVVRADLQIEAIFFRDWLNDKIIPAGKVLGGGTGAAAPGGPMMPGGMPPSGVYDPSQGNGVYNPGGPGPGMGPPR